MHFPNLLKLRSYTLAALLCGLSVSYATPAAADGDERLNAPTDPAIVEALANGNKIRISGTGLHSLPESPGTINIDLNDGEVIERVLLYWQVFDSDLSFDTEIDVVRTEDGSSYMVSGDVIGVYTGTDGGAPKKAFYNAYSATIRADITDMAIVQSGTNTLEISGLDLIELPNVNFGDDGKNGAGVMLIYSDGSGSSLQLVDGHDAAWWQGNESGFTPNRETTNAVRFEFDATDQDRFADISMFVASVEGSVQSGGDRPSVIEIRVGNDPADAVRDINVLTSNRGDEWDDYVRNFPIPAGASFVEVQLYSETDPFVDPFDPNNDVDPASFVWLAAGLSVPQNIEDACECRPKKLTFKFVGGNCAASNNDQGSKFVCEGDLFGANSADIIVSSNKKKDSNIDLSSNSVASGGTFMLQSSATGGQAGRLPAQSKLLLSNGYDDIFLDIHTSCSVPLMTGDQYGPLVLVGFEQGDQCDGKPKKKHKKKKKKHHKKGKHHDHDDKHKGKKHDDKKDKHNKHHHDD
ncbi:hypothetical protein [uncultured Ferrimonas sp.]|uniref:DUF7467 domain-containing protein n=1 Tax=uncultured Ferrimonas sp. TaxID=432640 RepID=UPI0026045CC5|nr:hypothetical protein [uncultured Ferrimonas sp.]